MVTNPNGNANGAHSPASYSTGGKIDARTLPDFDDLPKVDDMPQGCAWGVFGENDQLGSESHTIRGPRRGWLLKARD